MTTTTDTLKVQGMICRQCEDVVSTTLLYTRGVVDAKASYWKSSVDVTYDPDIVTEPELESAIERSGYPVGGGGVSGVVMDLICAAAVAFLVFAIMALKGTAIPKAKAGMSLGYIFVLGLITSTHCLGMCGGILLSQTTDASNLADAAAKRSKRGIWASLAYNGGRVASYTLVGAIFGALGAVISYTMTVKSMVFTIAGILVAMIGIQMWGIIPGVRRLSPDLPSFCKLPEKQKKHLYGKPLIIGLLTGIMPCGAMSAMWMYAMSTGSAGTGAVSMLLFSLGTVPLMFIFGAVNAFISQRYIKYMLKASAVMVLALGISMLISGVKMM